MKLLCLISGGIDSPVAAYLMKKHDVEFVHFEVSKSDKVKKLVKKINPKAKLHTIKHRKILEKIQKKCDVKQTCVLCKRAMLRAAEKLANKIGADALLTGDNLGQVASQTLDNLGVEEAAVKLPIIRPLIAFNKQEIIDIAIKIGTYPISITDAPKCLFVPKKPITNAKLDKIEEEEKRL